MPKLSAGISQIGGKFRLVNTILKYIPYHEFYLEPFLGAAWVLLNKPRCRYECGNDLNSELINYLLVVREYPDEFDALKQGIFGLVSQEICNRIVRGELVPKNNIERAYFYYYLNKLTFGGGIWMVRKEPPWKGIDPTDQAGKFDGQENVYETSGGIKGLSALDRQYHHISKRDIGKVKEEYELKTKGFAGIINTRAIPQNTLHDKDFEQIKHNYRGILSPDVPRTKEIEKIKAKSPYRGITGVGGGNNRCNKSSSETAKKEYKNAKNKGINPKTTRPYTNNDCGLLSPLKPNAIKRLRYVNLTTYPFQKVYNMFYKAFHVRKGLGPECFIYFDPPYPSTEKYYKSGFGEEDHKDLIKIFKESPFHCLLSIGSKCDMYLEELKDMVIVPVKVKYSTDANTKKDSKEYLIMNYDINELPLMQFSSEQKSMEVFF